MSRLESINEEEAPFLYDRGIEFGPEQFTKRASAKSLPSKLALGRDVASFAILLLNVFLLIMNAGWSMENLQSKSAVTDISQRPHGNLYGTHLSFDREKMMA
jgi:hypothetical protein